MRIVEGSQLELSSIQDTNIDLFICALNHELRCFTLYDKLIDLGFLIEKKVLLSYKESSSVIMRTEFTSYLPCIHNIEELSQIFDTEINQFIGKDGINIVLDYSCMTKIWYYTFILYIAKRELDFKYIRVYFGYTPSKFSIPQPPKYNIEIEPIPGTYRIPNDKPKALVVCLGYEEKKAEGIIDYLDTKEKYIYYSKPALDKRFEEKLLENNKDLLNNNFKVFTYPLNDLLYIEKSLTSLYYTLRDTHSVIIAPLGPKPFTLISMILSLKFNDIDIWKVSSGSDINEYPREPLLDSFIINDILFEQE